VWRLGPALAIPIGIGAFVLHGIWPDVGPSGSRRLLKGSLAVGCGLALSSCGFFLAVVLWGASPKVAVTTDVALLLAAAAFGLARRRPAGGRGWAVPDGAALSGTGEWTRLLRVVVGMALVAAVGVFVLLSWVRPNGEWDAWAFWNLRARFLFGGGAEWWREAFHPLAGRHPDYPLLLPGLVARTWLYVGRATVLAPVLVAMLFTFATVGVAAGAVAALRGETQGLLAALVLLGTVGFTAHGTMQYADIPLGFFVLATLVLLWLSDRGATEPWSTRCLAGAMAGFAAWTKQEAMLFVVALVSVRLVIISRGRGWGPPKMELFTPLACGLAPVLAIVAYFDLRLAPHVSFLWTQQLDAVRARLSDVARYESIGQALAGELASFGDWIISVVGLLIVYAVLVGTRVDAADRRPLAASVTVLGMVLAGYLGMFLLTAPYLESWLGSGLTRLLLHLWPSCVLVYWLAVKPLPASPGPAR
jgi:hypothetical protein